MAPTGETRPSEVIYQVYPSSFNDSDNDGLGDIPGITQKLDYIKSLGVEAIWLSPMYLSPPGPEGDGGYAVSDYRMIDPRFGTLDDFKTLLKEAHARGLRVYTDWVVAHTSHEHDWFVKSEKGDPAYKDFYTWSDGIDWYGHRAPPNNWKSVFGGGAWEWNETRGQYYLHHFLKSQPALNLNNKDVQDAVLGEMKFWLDMGVDGFRIDAMPFATSDEKLRNNPWINGTWPSVEESWGNQRLAHNILQPGTVDFIARIRALMNSYPQKKTTLGEVTEDRHDGAGCLPVASAYLDPESGLDMCYTYVTNFISQQAGQENLAGLVRALEQNFPDGGHCLSVGNHDSWRTYARTEAAVPEEHRLAAHKQLMQIFFTIPGSVILYQGEELGLPQARIPEDIPADKLRDITAQTQGMYACRDGSRTPMPWKKNEKNAGFSASDEPYLPVPAAHYPRAVDAEEKDPDSMLSFMRRLISWRAQQPALVRGHAQVLHTEPPVLAYLRKSRDQTLLCVFNLSGAEASFTPSDVLDRKTLEALHLQKHQTLTLAPYGSCFEGGQAPSAAPKTTPHLPPRP